MANTDLLITQEQFEQRILDFGRREQLTFFLRHQRTQQITVIPIDELGPTIRAPLAWQEILWCAKESPDTNNEYNPAKSGWMLLEAPLVYPDSILTFTRAGVQPYWLDETGTQQFCNNSLKELYSRLRVILIKGTIVGTILSSKTRTPSSNPNPSYGKIRYSPEVYELQSQCWSFVQGPRNSGPFYWIKK